MTPKLYKAADVCEMAQLQPYVLRSWEKEFPGIGVQRSPDSPRLYRQSDIDQVLRIKQLVFGEGLTLAGARKRLEGDGPHAGAPASEADEVLETLAADARAKIAHVREGLRSLLVALSNPPGNGEAFRSAVPAFSRKDDEEYELRPPSPPPPRSRGAKAERASTSARSVAARGKARTVAASSRRAKPSSTKRKRAGA